jgi:hypothetical protein
MAVEHNMAELATTWWDLLQKIATTLDWSYAALWTLTPDGRWVQFCISFLEILYDIQLWLNLLIL